MSIIYRELAANCLWWLKTITRTTLVYKWVKYTHCITHQSFISGSERLYWLGPGSCGARSSRQSRVCCLSLSMLAPTIERGGGGEQRWTNWFVAVAKIIEQFLSFNAHVVLLTRTGKHTHSGGQVCWEQAVHSNRPQTMKCRTDHINLSQEKYYFSPPPSSPTHAGGGFSACEWKWKEDTCSVCPKLASGPPQLTHL